MISRTWLRYPVGQRFAYSNLGIDLAGLILQKVSGMPFEDFVEKELMRPIGMKTATYDWKKIRASIRSSRSVSGIRKRKFGSYASSPYTS